VYKVDGHGQSGPSVGGKELNFSPMLGGRSRRPPLIFFPRGLAQGGLSPSAQNMSELE
jgi:hypothetical protein